MCHGLRQDLRSLSCAHLELNVEDVQSPDAESQLETKQNSSRSSPVRLRLFQRAWSPVPGRDYLDKEESCAKRLLTDFLNPRKINSGNKYAFLIFIIYLFIFAQRIFVKTDRSLTLLYCVKVMEKSLFPSSFANHKK